MTAASLPDPLRRAVEAARRRLAPIKPYLWYLAGAGIVVVALLQLYGPLPQADSSGLLLAAGAFALVWGALLPRAQRTLAVADRHGWKLLVGLVAVAGAVQELGLLSDYWQTVAIQLFLFAILALSWDLVGGQTGYPSFGNIAFFGVGGYTTAILLKDYGVDLSVAVVAAAVASLCFAAVIGAIVLRLRGGYFAIATLGVTLVAQQVATNLHITGGASGRILLDVPPQTVYYYALLATFVVEIAVVYYLTNTRFGYTLNAIRDDEAKATAMGVNTTYYKTAAWMISALFTGIAGGLYAPYLRFIDPGVALNNSWNVELIVMAFVGGTGTVAGPVIGAFGLEAIILQVESFFPGWQLVVLGVIVILTVVVFPEGLVGQLEARASEMEYYRHGGRAAGEERSDPTAEGGDD